MENTHNDHDFDRTEPEFELTKEPNTEIVDGTDDDQENQDEDAGIDLFRLDPVLNDQGRCSQLVRGRDDVFTPIRPSKSETEGGVNEAGRVAGETRCVRQPSSHLPEPAHDDVDQETDQGVGDEDGSRAAHVSVSRGAHSTGVGPGVIPSPTQTEPKPSPCQR